MDGKKITVPVSFNVGREIHSSTIDIEGLPESLKRLIYVLQHRWKSQTKFMEPVFITTQKAFSICREYREVFPSLALTWIFPSVNWEYHTQLTIDSPYVPLDLEFIRSEVFAQICKALKQELNR